MKSNLLITILFILVVLTNVNSQTTNEVKVKENSDKTFTLFDANTGSVIRTYDIVRPFSDGYARVRLKKKWGFIDKRGNEVVPLKYNFVKDFNCGLAVVVMGGKAIEDYSARGGKWGYIDTTGQEVIPLKYDWAGSFCKGFAPVELNNKSGFINKQEVLVLPMVFNYAFEFEHYRSRVSLNYVDKYVFSTGKRLLLLDYEWVGFLDPHIMVMKNQLYGVVDTTGKEIIPLLFKDIKVLRKGSLKVQLGDKWGIYHRNGQEIVPARYTEIKDFEGNFAKVLLNGKMGLIDTAFKEVLAPKYSDIKYFFRGYARVDAWGKHGMIDSTFREVIPPIYDYVGDFNEGLASVHRDGKSGFVDLTGKEVITPIYNHVSDFYKGRARVNMEYGGREFYIDKQGREVGALPLSISASIAFENWANAYDLSLTKEFRDTNSECLDSPSHDYISGCIYLREENKTENATIFIKSCLFYQNGRKVRELPSHVYVKNWIVKLPVGDYTMEFIIDKEVYNYTYKYKTTNTYSYTKSFSLTAERPYATIDF